MHHETVTATENHERWVTRHTNKPSCNNPPVQSLHAVRDGRMMPQFNKCTVQADCHSQASLAQQQIAYIYTAKPSTTLQQLLRNKLTTNVSPTCSTPLSSRASVSACSGFQLIASPYIAFASAASRSSSTSDMAVRAISVGMSAVAMHTHKHMCHAPPVLVCPWVRAELTCHVWHNTCLRTAGLMGMQPACGALVGNRARH